MNNIAKNKIAIFNKPLITIEAKLGTINHTICKISKMSIKLFLNLNYYFIIA